MSNLATVTPIRPILAAVERQVADLDDGYARLSNMLLEAYSGADLTKRHFKVLLAILRKTYGWNKPMDRISDSQLSEITKLPVKRCNEAKLELVRMNVIKQQGGMFGPNKNISEWFIPQNEGKPPKMREKTSLKMRESYPSKQGDTKDTIQKKEKQDPPKSPEGGNMLAQEVMDYFNELTKSRCSKLAPFEKVLSTVKSKGECYTADELKLVIRWAHVNWKHSIKPENVCRMTRFDGYLSDALLWADEQGSNPAACPHNEIISLWNDKFPAKAVSQHEWNRRRPAYRDLEAVWNGKTSQGNWRELRHMSMAFDLIGKSSLFSTKGDQPWLTLDWILNPKNWGSVYEQAINEHRQRKGVTA
ncbi:replication protein [Salmonella enterica]|uniref:Replication protein n=1 Tax=Salmonella enterica subsp. enterica serovar Javiana TaxID=363569 RepID=A0A728EL00_SALET|nr:replication protein [Salmonella enterica]EBH8433358.1 DNA replication protein [Salmonella enterica subsp. enterica serovar Javiana]ECE6045924.1 DNA replication protein [Salmonella enterica subsp. enterica]EDQ0149491.1 replication protein [Salmonella enterica subsp. enterica serovar Java]EDR9787649.1 replication protein [Salmonella enterica subsp. enterica serovar 4,[5],12:b:-]MBS2184765.1 replication protein [Salmonella enterica subsp. enterica serovar 1,4,[5],12:i:-]MBS2238123.1 replicati